MIDALKRFWYRLRGKRYGTGMWCFTGRLFWPLDPRAEEVDIDDIAHGLANECRFAGQALDYYSVAEHSVIVSRYVEKTARESGLDENLVRRAALAALLHDATEAYIGDVIRPLKYSPEMKPYRKAEKRVEKAIQERFAQWTTVGVTASDLISEMDSRVLVDEIGSLIVDAPMDDVSARYGNPVGAAIACLSPYQAECVFLMRFAELCPDYVAV